MSPLFEHASYPVGLFLFDSIWNFYQSFDHHEQAARIFDESPRFDPTRVLQANVLPFDYSARLTFIRRLKSEGFYKDVLSDERFLVVTALRIACCEWQETIDRSDHGFRHTGHVVELVDKDEVSGTLLKRRWLRDNLDRLKCSLNTIDGDLFRGEKQADYTLSATVGRTVSDLRADYSDLLSRVEDHIARANQGLATFTSLIAIEESKKAIRQAESIGYGLLLSTKSTAYWKLSALTSLATFYIPLSFVASLLGMNISQLSNGSSVSLWIFFAIAIPLTSASLIIVGKWAQVISIWRYLFNSGFEYRSRRHIARSNVKAFLGASWETWTRSFSKKAEQEATAS